jgi:hypothetical protein
VLEEIKRNRKNIISGTSKTIRIDFNISARSAESAEYIEALVTTCAVDCKEAPAHNPNSWGLQLNIEPATGRAIIKMIPIKVFIQIDFARSRFSPLKIRDANEMAVGPQIQLPTKTHTVKDCFMPNILPKYRVVVETIRIQNISANKIFGERSVRSFHDNCDPSKTIAKAKNFEAIESACGIKFCLFSLNQPLQIKPAIKESNTG